MRILITGASGRIGANVVKRLAERGDQVRCVVSPQSPRRARLEPFGVEIVEVDLRDKEGLTSAVENVEAVIHLGAKLRNTTNFDQLDINTAPTLTLLEAVRTLNPDIRRFVYGSSDTLYPHTGYFPDLITRDDIFSRPGNMYAVSKVSGEAMVQCYHQQYAIPTVSLTIPYTFCGREFLGERVDSISPLIESHLKDLRRRPETPERDRTISELQARFEQGDRLVIPLCAEGPAHKHHLGDVRDVAAACVLALDRNEAVGEAFIIMSKPFHTDQAVPHLSQVSGLDCAEVVFPYSQFYEYDVRHTEEKLGFSPQYDGKQMLEDAWRHKHGEDIGVIDVGPG